MTAMLQGAADAHRFATRRDDYLRMVANAEAAERAEAEARAAAERAEREDAVLARFSSGLRIYRLIAWVARATDTRPRHIGLVEAGAEIIAAAAERLEEVEGR